MNNDSLVLNAKHFYSIQFYSTATMFCMYVHVNDLSSKIPIQMQKCTGQYKNYNEKR